MTGLIKNESIKIYRQTGYRVLIIIILALAILIPVGSFVVDKIMENTMYRYSAQERYESDLKDAENFREEGSKESQILAEYMTASADALKFFIDNEIDGSWKEDMFFEYVRQRTIALYLMQKIADKEFTLNDIMEAGESWYIDDYLSGGKDQDLFDGTKTNPYGYTEDSVVIIDKEVDYSKVDWSAECEELKNTLQKDQKRILNASPKLILETYVENAENQLLQAKSALEQAKQEVNLQKSLYEADKNEKTLLALKNAEYTRDQADASLTAAEEALWAYEFLYDKECEPTSWQYRAVTDSYIYSLSALSSSVPMPEEVFAESYDAQHYDSYEDYLKAFEENRDKAALDSIKIIRYALENDIALPQYLQDGSVKNSFRSSFNTLFGMISIFLIVMAGMIIASEHTEGTIRLLVIRPKKRHKIMTSKILTMLLYTVGVVVVSGVVLFLFTLIFNGVGDLFVPDVTVMHDNAVAIPAFVTFLISCAAQLASTLLIASVALFFSTLTKRSVLSIAFPLIIMTVLSVVQLLSLTLIQYLPFLKFTILPYVNPEMLLTNPLSDSYSYNLIQSVLGLPYGIFMLAIHTILVVVLTYVVFHRQQIKN